MDKKKFLEGLTGMSTKEYIQVLISDYKNELEIEQDTNIEKKNEIFTTN